MRGMTDQVDGVMVQWFDCDGCVTPTDPVGEWYDQTLWVGAQDFRTENMSFAGSSREPGRNMALQVQADRAYFKNSRFYGDASDTLYTGGMDHRAYFDHCYINGSYDFLWGLGTAVFADTTIVGSENIAAHKGTQIDRNGVLGGCTGDARFGKSCTAYLMLNCKLPRPTGYTGGTPFELALL
jgi:pectin methylesterase-like acyl-CoA thioesterase